MRTTLFLLIAFFLISAQTPPSIKTTHPRTWLPADRFVWLKNHKDSGDVKTSFVNLTNAYYGWWINDAALGAGAYLAGSDSSLWKVNFEKAFVSQCVGITMATAQMQTDSLAWKRLRYIASQFTAFADTAKLSTMEHYAGETLLRELAEVGSILVDWSGDSLGTTVKGNLVQAHYKLTELFYKEYLINYSGGKVYVSSHNAKNNQLILRNIFSLYGDASLTAIQQKNLDEWYGVIWDKWINGFFKAYAYYRDNDGGWNWGAAYAKWGLETQFPLFDDVLFATGFNLYTEQSWVQSTIQQFWHFYQPDNKTIHHGDGITAACSDVSIYRHAAVFKDPMSIWLVQKYVTPQFITWTIPIYDMFLYRDFSAPKLNTMPAVSTNWYTDKVGLSISRTGWDSTATVLLFNNSLSKRASHEHRDNNSFILFHKAPLLVDAGFYDSYGSSHWDNYYVRSVAHNTLTVFDSTEQFHSGNNVVSNDGGQIESPQMATYDDIFKPQNQRGIWFSYSDGRDFSYSDADAGLSYDSTKVTHFRRRILFEKPSRITIFDHIILKGTTNKQRKANLLFHTINRPDMQTTPQTVIIPNHIESYTAKTSIVKNGNGEARITTLLPHNATATLIGGTGYEFWVNGTNYPPKTIDTATSTAGNWRIEVSPQISTDSLQFMHSISVGDLGTVTETGILVQGQSGTGVDYGSSLHLFASDGICGQTNLATDIGGTNRTITLFVADLRPNTRYSIQSGTNTTIAESDSSGFLRTQCLVSAGTLSLQAKETAILTNTEIPKKLIQFDTAKRVNISLPKASHVSIQILSPTGRVIRTIANEVLTSGTTQFVWDNREENGNKVASGVYVCVVKTAGCQAAKMYFLRN